MLDQAIADHTWTDDDLRRVGSLLAEFYKTSSPAEISAAQYRKRLMEDFDAACLELLRCDQGLPANIVDSIRVSGTGLIERQPRMFDDRVHAGRIIDGHGDLRAEHICLEPQPVVIDCLEFNPSLRILDFVSELTFLKLECERLGAIEVGERIMEAYHVETGDRPPQQILQFYKNYHACVRAKLAVWHLRDSMNDASKWIDRAKIYLQIAAQPH
jgi:aminoglycoside phosphotransferase family enzyme